MITIILQVITFHKCEHLKVKDLMVLNSQQMHVALTECAWVSVSNLTLLSPPSSPNTDAVHISSSIGVKVKDSIFRTGKLFCNKPALVLQMLITILN